MQKLVLIIPPSPWLISDTDIPFLGVLYIASFIKQNGYEVQVCDLSGLEEKNWKIPVGDVYGITGTSPNFPYMKRISEILKPRGKTIVFGGVHATVMSEHALKNSQADICVIGEGENTMLEIMQGRRWDDIKGVEFKAYFDKTFKTEPRPFIKNLDVLPLPDREAIDFYRYIKPQTYGYLKNCNETTIMASRGCPFSCAFCASNKIWKRTVRYHSPDYVIKEINYLKTNYNVGLIYFDDDTFVLNKNRVIELCAKLKTTGISWHCLNRVDMCDPDILKIMKDSGCISFVIGFETGSNKLLKTIDKKATVEQAYEAIRNIKKLGMMIRGQMMVGLPGETDETVKETEDFIRKADVDKFGVHIFQPVPGCEIFNDPEKFNYNLNFKNDFSNCHTIGKPNAKNENNQVQEWAEYLRKVAGEKSIEWVAGKK